MVIVWVSVAILKVLGSTDGREGYFANDFSQLLTFLSYTQCTSHPSDRHRVLVGLIAYGIMGHDAIDHRRTMRLLSSLVAAIRTNKLKCCIPISRGEAATCGDKIACCSADRNVATATTAASMPPSQCCVPFSGCQNTAVVVEV
jgi:hypothetical protein